MSRRAAALIWAALVATPLLFGVLALGETHTPRRPDLAGPVLLLALAASLLNVVLSRVLPARLGPRAANDRDAVAFSRLLVGFALCVAAAMAPLVAYLVTGDGRLLVLGAADVVALLLLYPTDRRWERSRPEPVGGPRGPVVT